MKFEMENCAFFPLSALFSWIWFSASITLSTVTLIGNVNLIKRIRFPRHFLVIGLSEEIPGGFKGFNKGGGYYHFVSHSMDAIREISDRTIWLADGGIRAEGEPKKVVEEYLRCSG